MNPDRIKKSKWTKDSYAAMIRDFKGCKIGDDFYVIDAATGDLVKQLPKSRKRNTNTKQTHKQNATTQN